MAELKFTAEDHKYQSVNDPDKKWISATGLVHLFKEDFPQEEVALKCSKNKKSKWYGMTPKRIIEVWEEENKRATTIGSWYHDQRESDIIACDTLQRNGVDLQIFRPHVENGVKFSTNQSLVPGIYPEHLAYLKSAKVCGQADRVEVVGDVVNIYDYKTNKKIDVESYKNWEGIHKKLNPPLNHLDDCNYFHYALQLSIYMYIILKHNHGLKPGKLEIDHIVFERAGENEYGYPVIAKGANGDPIIKEIVPHELPYLKKEVVAMIKYLKTNPQ